MVHVDLHLVEALCCHGEPHKPVYPNHPAPARRERKGVQQAAWADVLRLGVLSDLTRANVRLHVARLPWPVHEPANQRRRLVPPGMAAQRSVVALVQNPAAKATTIRHAEPVCLPLPLAVEKAAANDEGTACRAGRSRGDRLALAVYRTTYRRRCPFEDGGEEGIRSDRLRPSGNEVRSEEVALREVGA
jgi:hypothetical protein